MELRETLTCALACVMFFMGSIFLGFEGSPLWEIFTFVGIAIAAAFGAGWGFSKMVNKGNKK